MTYETTQKSITQQIDAGIIDDGKALYDILGLPRYLEALDGYEVECTSSGMYGVNGCIVALPSGRRVGIVGRCSALYALL